MSIRLMFRIVAFFYLSQNLFSANVKGKVSDGSSGNFLPGANVFLSETNYGSSSDRAGNFSIENVPAGDYVLKVTYVGYADFSVDVTLGDESLTQDISLGVDYVAMGAVNVNGLSQGQAKALSQQRSAGNIKNIVSKDQMEKFPDQNVADVLQRLPGVALESDHGEGRYVQIRGAEASLNTTTINGIKVPSPEDVRKISLDIIPSYSLGGVEVTKAITPDMDADAIGGHVNLITKNAFDYDGQFMEAKVAGGHRPLYGKNGNMAAFTYGNQFMDGRLGLIVSASHEFNDMKTDNIELEWDDKYEYVSEVVDTPEDEENGATYVVEEADGDILTDMQLKNYALSRQRTGITANLDYKLSEKSNLHLNILTNTYTDTENRNRLRYRFDKSVDEEEAGSGYDPVDGMSVVKARIGRELKSRSSISKINSYSFGGDHALGKLDIDWSLTTAYSEELRDPSLNAEFVAKDVDYSYNLKDRNHPVLSDFMQDGEVFDQHDLTKYELDEIEIEGDYIPSKKSPNGNLVSGEDQVAALNLAIPLSLGNANGEFKFGTKLSTKEKKSDKSGGEVWGWDGDADILMDAFQMNIEGAEYMGGNYVHTLGIDVDKVRDHMKANQSSYEILPIYEDAILETWDATEDVSAFYGMFDMKMGKLNFIGGARMEKTAISYNANSGDVSAAEDEELGLNESIDSFFVKINKEKDYTDVLPMFHARYAVNDRALVRAAFTNTISRADFAALVPFVNNDGGEAEAGNPDLESAHSQNIDLMFEYYPKGLGIFSLGYFSKSIDNYIYTSVQKDVQIGGTGTIYDELVMPVNGKKATLSGWEMNVQKNLDFLPGPLSSLSLYFNFTSTSSEADYGEEREKTTFPGQAAKTGNLSLAFETSKLTARFSQSIADKYITEIGGDKTEDIFYKPANRLDLSLSYNLGSKMTLFADFLNLTDVPHIYYMGNTDNPIEKEVYGSTIKVGTSYRF